MKLDHATLRTADLDGTLAFLQSIFDVKVGYRPPFSFPGYWLYAEGKPLIHLIPARPSQVDRIGEAIDHVGLLVTDYDSYLAKLKALGIHFHPMELPELNERRLFIRTPTGILLELVFREPPPMAET